MPETYLDLTFTDGTKASVVAPNGNTIQVPGKTIASVEVVMRDLGPPPEHTTWPEAFQTVGIGLCCVLALCAVVWGFNKLCNL